MSGVEMQAEDGAAFVRTAGARDGTIRSMS